LREVFCNLFFELIDNALKFSEDNKIIMVSGTTYNEEFYELILRFWFESENDK
jgi:hypothetical protein